MKDKGISFDNAMQELEQKKKQDELLNEAANARSPLNDPGRSAAAVMEQMERMGDDGTNYKMPYQRPDLNKLGGGSWPQHDSNASLNTQPGH